MSSMWFVVADRSGPPLSTRPGIGASFVRRATYQTCQTSVRVKTTPRALSDRSSTRVYTSRGIFMSGSGIFTVDRVDVVAWPRVVTDIDGLFSTARMTFAVSCQRRSAVFAAEIITERPAWCYLQVKLCDPCLSALSVPPWPKKRYINTLPFLTQPLIGLVSQVS